MKKIIKIEGMKCENCSAHVKEALEALDSNLDVKISLFRKQATVEGENLNDEALKEAVEKAGYKVLGIN
ncbi:MULTISPECIES: heavy-metal-associated domain-containing protein [Peptoniphilus]|uniref:Heavy metal-associated domain protein n=1 Tax=Peptoniphilus duerdenii ATCC BAA-1640 TaxID=862517 RepID=E0NKL3_9FIRM|nr:MULTISPECIES: heavy-metal-associated domain-containing protein [Peptoniphilus]EFM25640.1 heavy metal-associated domain protein [Peptoniphilus duerdenii ATCC BAA-1640]ERT64679.1 heavy metal-associated domain protein [Peptoniphilus sp. BV3AC2]MDK8276123.1 heavy-metal-associated domain-containing protein [Peptoniphilus duerdenii]